MVKPGDRTLAIWIYNGIYHFSTYTTNTENAEALKFIKSEVFINLMDNAQIKYAYNEGFKYKSRFFYSFSINVSNRISMVSDEDFKYKIKKFSNMNK